MWQGSPPRLALVLVIVYIERGDDRQSIHDQRMRVLARGKAAFQKIARDRPKKVWEEDEEGQMSVF